MSIILFLVILAALIFFHELGHFTFAKLFKIRVDEFALGFPPRLFSFRYGETEYTLNLIPFGGYVKIFGENPEEKILVSPDSGRSFMKKNRLIQSAVLVAGIAFNMLFAWILMAFALSTGLPAPANYEGVGTLENQHILVGSILEKSPAATAGFKQGDTITAAKTTKETFAGTTAEELRNFIQVHTDEEITFTVTHGDEPYTLTTKAVEGLVPETPDKKIIGFGIVDVGILKLPLGTAFIESVRVTKDITVLTAQGLYTFFTQAFAGKADFSQVTGPVGIVTLVGEEARFGLAYLLQFTAVISINLAIINLLPFPALDGGRLAVVLIEALIRRPLNYVYVNMMNMVGFALLMLLMVAVTYHDIVRLVSQ
jgi:regulator of sigma E protease